MTSCAGSAGPRRSGDLAFAGSSAPAAFLCCSPCRRGHGRHHMVVLWRRATGRWPPSSSKRPPVPKAEAIRQRCLLIDGAVTTSALPRGQLLADHLNSPDFRAERFALRAWGRCWPSAPPRALSACEAMPMRPASGLLPRARRSWLRLPALLSRFLHRTSCLMIHGAGADAQLVLSCRGTKPCFVGLDAEECGHSLVLFSGWLA